jgi:hypothetical protein
MTQPDRGIAGQPGDHNPFRDAHGVEWRDIANASPSEASVAAAEPARDDAERARLMAEFGIAYNGRHYEYDRYRYDRLDDAVAYATLRRANPVDDQPLGPMPAPEIVEVPDDAQRRVMSTLAISYREGVYRVGPFRYDRLADALRYANSGSAAARRVVGVAPV